MPETPPRFTDIRLETGATLRVAAITPHVFRLRLSPDGYFPEPGLVRYGVVRTDWPEVPASLTDDGEVFVIDTGAASLAVTRSDGRLSFRDAAGNVLAESPEPPRSDPRTGFQLDLDLRDGERLYGLGDVTRDRLQKRGHEARIVLQNVVSYVPIPFLMSSAGWAIFLNTTWFHRVDAGASRPDRLSFRARRGELDFYLIAGASLPELLDRYTEITGRPALLPLWAYGLTYVCDERGVRARDVLYEAHEFRREATPCDVIGLEPLWMDKNYDFSIDKQWSTERFHVPEWLPHRSPGGFTAALANMGFKLSLWLCCDYDVSDYEECQLQSLAPSSSDESERSLPGRYEEDIIRDPHFTPVHLDNLTRPGEGWFEHLKKFVDDGAEAFKMDGSNQVCFHPDRKWRNGMDDEEMHNLYPVLLAKQMSLGYRDYTARRPMIYTAAGYAGVQQYAATWAGDTGGGEKPLVSLLNLGLSGHSNTSCDMQVWTAAGIHFGFLQPWSQILSWHQYNQPWFLPEDTYAIYKFYARLRYRLLPYLYSTAHVAARTGLPIMRAMPLVAPDDPRSDDLLTQYMLGDALLTSAFTDTLFLPAGRWIDYWTGREYEGPMEFKPEVPADRGGPLFVRAGAILPTAPDMDFVGQVPFDTLGLDIYAGGSGSFTLYEDDGISPAYLGGRVATTEIKCEEVGEKMTITIGPRVGAYDNMPEHRTFNVSIHAPGTPYIVSVDAPTTPEHHYDPAARSLKVSVSEDPDRKKPAVIVCTRR
jgi:alpha-glucosidase (family GH31 glycosyl hydrolase)